ncbi:MAG: hypothetical protein IPK94_21040 [Saprospiraceae bacterium]|nr:hypothetical protein [Saprospiraceae bacterium]
MSERCNINKFGDRQNCDDKARNFGTIDPSTNGLMNPQTNLNGQNIRVPVSVEHVNGYLDMAKNDFGITNEAELKDIYLKLTDHIHPLSLGNVYKSKAQIKMLAEKMLKYHSIDPENISKVISFLCSESGSHDYTIYRKEAKEELGLNVEKPDDELYSIIKAVYQDIEAELELRNPYNPNVLLAIKSPYQYLMRRALIESTDEGQMFLSVKEHWLNKLCQLDRLLFKTIERLKVGGMKFKKLNLDLHYGCG